MTTLAWIALGIATYVGICLFGYCLCVAAKNGDRRIEEAPPFDYAAARKAIGSAPLDRHYEDRRAA
jgi:hypothetical protein